MNRLRRRIFMVLVLLVVALPASAQLEYALSAYSPYTMFGLGDLSVGGNASSRAMGGMGIAMRNPSEFNYLNPAALSAMPQRTAIFNFGMMNANYYQNSDNVDNAFNTANLNDLALAFPIARGLAFGVSLTPYSSVGYETNVINSNPSVVENIGRAVYSYYGEGGVSELNASIGWRVFSGFSIGATMHYDFGSIDRNWTADVKPLLGETGFSPVVSSQRMQIEKLRFSFGAQYQFRVGYDDHLIVGATYDLNSEAEYDRTQISFVTTGTSTDTVAFNRDRLKTVFPEKLAVGITYNNPKLTVGFDYSRQDWTGTFEVPSFVNLFLSEDYRVGAAYTPDRRAVGKFLKRVTYRIGGRYATNYIGRNGHQPIDWTVSCGVGIPLKAQNVSAVNLAFEYGQRGAIDAVLNEQYFKVVIGLSLFGSDDMWFVKRKFN